MNLEILPGDCLSQIFSFTSPRDACCASLVSSLVRFWADSDMVWDIFLPYDYQDILSRLVCPIIYSSKKELFLRLCDPHLIDGGRKIFSLDKFTGKKQFILSAREISIAWANNHLYWSWKSYAHSRFREVVELRTIWWLEINCKINTQMLSPQTTYGAYLIVKFASRAFGLDTLPSEVSLEVGSNKLFSKVYLRCDEKIKQALELVYYLNRTEALRSRIIEDDGGVPRERTDGWMEVELGRFYNNGGDNEVKMCLKETTGEHLKGGLIIEGIELRPI